jgi:hypothetical protein
LGDIGRDDYLRRRADIATERKTFEIGNVFEEIMEIRADHVEGNRLLVTFKPWPHWEPYVDAVLARKAATESAGDPVSTSGRKTGLQDSKRTFGLVRQSTDRVSVIRAAA